MFLSVLFSVLGLMSKTVLISKGGHTDQSKWKDLTVGHLVSNLRTKSGF